LGQDGYKWFSFRVQRSRNVYKFFLDDAEIYVARYPGLMMRSIRFSGYQQHFALRKIAVKPLSPDAGR
jgi:hypothetical protein